MAHSAILSCVLLLTSLSIAVAQTAPAQPAAPPVDTDANAYRAFAAGNQADLARWQSAGGDAARYARDNPNAIYDAMGAERDVEVLEFVLKSGANPNVQRPNLKGGPIFANMGDRDKIALLVRYGADVNARDHNGYAPLSYVLFAPSSEFKVPLYPRPGQKVRVFSKVEVVRLLLDSGAEVNGNLGGWGHGGALGLARREDKDVIALLIERGATLKDDGRGPLDFDKQTGDRGPVTLAIQLDRDDLALALLGRDKRIAPNDTLALLEATRRGFSEAALAILSAGAEANAADGQGVTPLAWAIRRKDTALTAALRKAGAKTPVKTAKPQLDSLGLDKFEAAMGNEIDEVALFDPDRYTLTVFAPRPDVAFAFYGDGVNKFEAVKCERSIRFGIIAYANDAGSVLVGICRKEAARVRSLARGANTGLSEVVRTLAQSVPNPEQLKSVGWEWQQARHEGGLESYSFPVLMVGHGVLWVSTVALLNRANDRAIVVQADLYGLCPQNNRLRTPLCSETAKALTDIALRVNRLAGRE